MRRDVDRDQSITGFAGRVRPALPFQPDLLTARNSGGNLDLDVLARRQVHPRRRTLRRVRKCDRQRSVPVLPCTGRRTEIFIFILRTITTRRASAAAKHSAQKILETSTGAAAGRTTKAIGSETETFEVRPTTTRSVRATRLRAEPLEALETWLAFGV